MHVHVHTVPSVVQNLICTKSSISSSSVLSLLWELPTKFQNETVGYRIEVKRLQHKLGTREVIQLETNSFETMMRAATLNQGLGINYNCVIADLSRP